MSSNINYTPEQTQEVIKLYTDGNTAEQIAAFTGRTKASIVAKLVRESVYKTPETAQEKRLKKSEMIADIAEAVRLNGEPINLDTLEKASHPQLAALRAAILELKAALNPAIASNP